MVTFQQILRPNGNVTSNWFIFDFNNINKPVEDPAVPDLSPAVVAKDTDGFETQSYSFTNPDAPASQEIRSIVVNFYSGTAIFNPIFTVNIKVGSTTEPSQTIGINVNAWRNLTFLNNNWTVSDLDSLELNITSPSLTFKSDVNWFAIYAEIRGREVIKPSPTIRFRVISATILLTDPQFTTWLPDLILANYSGLKDGDEFVAFGTKAIYLKDTYVPEILEVVS